jgi:hypothetical protein
MPITYHKIIIFNVISAFIISPVFVLGADPPKEIIEKQCSKCHPTSTTYDAKKSRDEWQKTIDRMISYGATLNKEEREAVIKYLLERK